MPKRFDMFDVLKPNKAISQHTQLAIVVGYIVLTLGAWTLASGELLPSPIEVGHAFLNLSREGLFYEMYQSFSCNLEAIGISMVISLFLSYLTVLPIARPLVEFCSKARFFGITGFTVLFTILFGGGHGLKLALLVFGMSVFFVTSMAAVVASIPRAEFDHARTLRMSEWRVVWEVVVLGRIDMAFEVLRQNAAIGWVMLTMVEGLVRSEGGLGSMMLNENKHFKLAAVFAIQIVVLVVGYLQDRAIVWTKKLVCPYADLTLERQ